MFYAYLDKISGEHLQDHWSSGLCYLFKYLFTGFSVFTVLISRIYSRIRRNLPADAILGIVVFN